jgi:hypothetical protein
LAPDGGCINGHGPEGISGIYEVAEQVAAPPAYGPSPTPERPRRTGKIILIVVLALVVLVCGCGVIGFALFAPVTFQSAADSARSKSCNANLRTLNGAVEQWALSGETNDPTALDSLDEGRAAIGQYLKDYDTAVACPSGGEISVTDGHYTCSIPEHNPQ